MQINLTFMGVSRQKYKINNNIIINCIGYSRGTGINTPRLDLAKENTH